MLKNALVENCYEAGNCWALKMRVYLKDLALYPATVIFLAPIVLLQRANLLFSPYCVNCNLKNLNLSSLMPIRSVKQENQNCLYIYLTLMIVCFIHFLMPTKPAAAPEKPFNSLEIVH